MPRALQETGSLLRDISWLVMASLIAVYVLDIDRERDRRNDERDALAWHRAITLNALSERSMLVGGNIFLQCRSTLISDGDPLLEPERSRLRRANYEHMQLAKEQKE